MPVDDPNTHLELTMIHEVMILDASGFDLMLYQYAASLKLLALLRAGGASVESVWRARPGGSGLVGLRRDARRTRLCAGVDRNAYGAFPTGARAAVPPLRHRDRHPEHPDLHVLPPAMINVLTILFCLTLIYLACDDRLSAYVLILVSQGMLRRGSSHTGVFSRLRLVSSRCGSGRVARSHSAHSHLHRRK